MFPFQPPRGALDPFAICRSLVLISLVALLMGNSSNAEDDAPIAKHERWVTSAAFAPDGKILATGGGQSLQYRAGDVKLWDVQSGKPIASLEGHEANVWCIAFSPDGKTLISSAYDGKVIVWDIKQRKQRATLDKHTSWVRAVAFAGDGNHFATADEEGNVAIWRISGNFGWEAKSIKAHDSAVYSVAFSPDSQTLATASTDKTVKLWDWQAGKEKTKLEGHQDAVWSVAYSPDGTRLATAGADRRIILWDAAGKRQATLYGHLDWISCVRFSPDGKLLASSALDRTVKIWDLATTIKAADSVAEVVQQVAAKRKAVTEADTAAAEAQSKADAASKRVDVIEAIIHSKEFAEKVKQTQLAANKDKENVLLAKLLEDAKKAADEAAKDATAKIKEASTDKAFGEQLEALQGGSIDQAVVAKAKVEIDAELATAQLKNAETEKETSEKELAELDKKRKEMFAKQGSNLPGYKSTVWTVASSPDTALLASGSHKDSIKVWKVANKSESFSAPTSDEVSKSD